MNSSFIDKFTAVAAKIGSQRHLAAIRDGFISLMPLIIAGSLALIIKNIPIPSIEKWQEMVPSQLLTLCNMVWWGTFGVLTIYAIFSISYHLAKSYNGDGLQAGFVSIASFFALVPDTITNTLAGLGVTADQVVNEETLNQTVGMWGNINWGFTSANSLFQGIIVALIATELFVRFSRMSALQIKLPASVPPAVGRSFSVLIPATFTIFIVAILEIIIIEIAGKNIFVLVTDALTPLVNASDSLAGGIVVVLLCQIFWSFGLHGPNIIGGVFEPLSLKLMGENIAAFEAGKDIPHIMTKPFLDAFVHIGGSGATLGLVIALFIVGRSKLMRTMGKTCVGPGLFNINEPVIFGIPIVLNPILFAPFIVGPLILTTVSYYATVWGLVDRTVAQIPWATPPIISGWMVTGGDWRACLLQIINIAIMVALYLPFIRIVDKLEQKKEAEPEKTAV